MRTTIDRVPLPTETQDVAGILDTWVLQRPDAQALVDRHRSLDFKQLNAEVKAGAAFLESLGVNRGDRVAASTGNQLELVVAFLAVQRLGAIWVGMNRRLAAPEKQYLLDDAKASVLLADTQTAEAARSTAARGVAPTIVTLGEGGAERDWSRGLAQFEGRSCRSRAVDPWAAAAIAYTSGTTGRPKGVVHSQHSIVLAATIAALNSGRFDSAVVRATATPLTILNLMILGPVCAFVTGARHVCIDRVDAAGVAEWIRRERVNTISLPPPTVSDLIVLPGLRDDALESIEWLVVGGASVPSDLPAKFKLRFGRELTIGYGQTECPTGMSMTSSDSPNSPGCVGRPHRHLEVSIRDGACAELANGECGEICYRATGHGAWAHVYSGPLGYWGNPQATEALWRGGWVHSGDLGHLDSFGNLFIEGRRSDVIIRGGANVYPAEVERVLRMHVGVRDCAVVGVRDDRLGQVVGAAIEATADHSTGTLIDELLSLCSGELARYKIPVRWILLPDLPRNAMRKVIKDELSQLLAAVPDCALPRTGSTGR